MSDRYAVIGNPIAHSRSPQIHAAFARQTGEDIVYERLPAPDDGFADTASGFLGNGGRGLNVTVPFKHQAYRLVEEPSARARRAGAVNTIWLYPDGRRRGDNTDGAGLVRDLKANCGLALASLRILLVGAGGAAAGVVAPLLEAQAGTARAALTIANRTAEKAAALARRYADIAPVRGVGFAALADLAPFDLIINATAAGLHGHTPDLPEGLLAPGAVVYDMQYGARPTAFEAWAQAQGAAHSWDGTGMLVEQAAESFALWRGLRPETAPVIAALRADLGT